jgi:ABC-type arginine transport system permease subunit
MFKRTYLCWCLLFFINVFISLTFLQYLNVFINKTYKTKFFLLAYCCYATALREVPEVCLLQTETFSGLQKYLRFQNEYNKVEI